MRTLTMVATVLLLHAVSVSAQTDHGRPSHNPAPSPTEARPTAAAPAHLVGNWTSNPDRISLTTAFDESVWGKNATSVRTVTLNVLASGKATLVVTRKVLNAKGTAVPGSTSIERADLVIGAAREPVASRVEYETTVASAERRYPDMPDSKWPLDGLRVTLSTLEGEENKSIEVRFDTPEGRGSFWETLHRAAVAAKR
jgi:hypothetical protein